MKEPVLQLERSRVLSKKTAIWVRIGLSRVKYLGHESMNISPVALVMHNCPGIALCVNLRTTSVHWILTVHISNGTKDRLMMASEHCYSSITMP